MLNNKERKNNMEEKKIDIVEEPILNLKVEVDETIGDRVPRTQRLNWKSFNYIDLIEVFQMNICDSNKSVPLHVAERNALTFKRKLKAYIIEKADESELKNFDWSEWDIV